MGPHVVGHQRCSSGLSSRAGSVQCLDKRRLRGNLIALYSFLGRGSGEGGDDLFSLGSSDGMCGNG